LRYVDQWGHWFEWEGRKWSQDNTLKTVDLVRHGNREAARECPNPRIAKAIASAKMAGSVERLAKADRRLAATTEN
jgi:putative DNA primase/helicase